jgi:epoxyqueuosine reductase
MKNEIISLLDKREISLFGISESKELTEIPAQFSPRSYLKDCRSVLCYAVPIPKGILHAPTDSSLFFWRFSNMTYRLLDTVSNEICTLIEAHGHLAAPIYSCFPWKDCGKQFYGLMPLTYLAQECGIGKLTRSGLVGNARFGTRLLLGGVITSAALEKTAKASEQLCPSDCFLCREACPPGAIEQNGRVDHSLCIRHSGANPLLAHLLADREIKAKFGFDTLLNSAGVDDHGMYTCSKCLEVCPLNR